MTVLLTLFHVLWVLEDEMPFNPDDVTPGWVGFAVTAALALTPIVLGVLMVRTIRRITYREQVRDELAEEMARAQHPSAGAGQGGSGRAAAPSESDRDLT